MDPNILNYRECECCREREASVLDHRSGAGTKDLCQECYEFLEGLPKETDKKEVWEEFHSRKTDFQMARDKEYARVTMGPKQKFKDCGISNPADNNWRGWGEWKTWK